MKINKETLDYLVENTFIQDGEFQITPITFAKAQCFKVFSLEHIKTYFKLDSNKVASLNYTLDRLGSPMIGEVEFRTELRQVISLIIKTKESEEGILEMIEKQLEEKKEREEREQIEKQESFDRLRAFKKLK